MYIALSISYALNTIHDYVIPSENLEPTLKLYTYFYKLFSTLAYGFG